MIINAKVESRDQNTIWGHNYANLCENGPKMA